MATSEVSQAQYASNSRTRVSIGLSIVVVVLVILFAYIAHRLKPKMPTYDFTTYTRTREGQSQKDIESRILDTMPVIRYDSTFQRNKPRAAVNTPGLAKSAPPRTRIPVIGRLKAATTFANVRRREEYNDERTARDLPLSASGSELPLERLTRMEQEIENCSICTEDLEQGQNVRILPCSHIYHRRCIDPWLLSSSGTCPLCRTLLPGFASSPEIPGVRRPEQAYVSDHGRIRMYPRPHL